MYNKLKEKLIEHFNPNVYQLLKDAGCYVAGGAITSLFTNKEINDLDIYFPSKEKLIWVLDDIYHNHDYLTSDDMWIISKSDKSLSITQKHGNPIQFIHFKYFKTAEDIFNTFDFTCVMGCFDMRKEEFILHDNFLLHASQRYLKYNPSTAYPLVSALRVEKYKDKGYSISKSEYIRVLLSINNLEITSWAELASHVGGMYGNLPKDIFPVDEEFDILKGIEALSVIDSHQYKLEGAVDHQCGFEDIVQSLYEVDHCKVAGRFFKWVKPQGKEYISPARSISQGGLYYNDGEVTRSVGNGIYCSDWYKVMHNAFAGGDNKLIELIPLGDLKLDGEELSGGSLFQKYFSSVNSSSHEYKLKNDCEVRFIKEDEMRDLWPWKFNNHQGFSISDGYKGL